MTSISPDPSRRIHLAGSTTFKIDERISWQITAGAFNWFSRSYYGTPDLNIEYSLHSPDTFETTLFIGPPNGSPGSGAGGSPYPQGLGNRNIQLMGKIIF